MAYKNPQDERAKEARRKHYYRNKEKYYSNNKKKKEVMMNYIRDIKDVPCKDCGIKYCQYVMEFNHRDPLQKTFNISTMAQRGSLKKMIEEIAKCDVVCANCHRLRTAKSLGWKL